MPALKVEAHSINPVESGDDLAQRMRRLTNGLHKELERIGLRAFNGVYAGPANGRLALFVNLTEQPDIPLPLSYGGYPVYTRGLGEGSA